MKLHKLLQKYKEKNYLWRENELKLTQKETTQTEVNIDYCCDKAKTSFMFIVKDGKIGIERLLHYIPIPINFCPFCGTKVNNEKVGN